jgi:hypothetical protein
MDNIIELKTILGWSSEPRMVGICKRHPNVSGLRNKTMLSTTITDIVFDGNFAVVTTKNKTTFKVTGDIEPLRRLNALLKCQQMEKRNERRQYALCL